MNIGKKTQKEAMELKDAIYNNFDKLGLPQDFSVWDNIRAIYRLKQLAKSHCRLQELNCNGELTKRQESRERNIEKEIAGLAKLFNLTATFDGDPRGYTVKLHWPTKDVYNTWGGAESGFGI